MDRPAARNGTKRHTILVVDDEPDVVKSVQDLLRLDYRVLGATRADQALEIVEKEQVHVLMTDQRMPEMTGVEFLRRVRDLRPDIIRLLFTGYADIRAVIDAINQGSVYRYITKPWDADELQTLIRQAVERWELTDERRKLVEQLQAANAQLQTANAQLKEADTLKSAFIQVASHELRTPLAILRGLLGLAMNGATPAETCDYLSRISSAADRLGRLVNQLITMLSLNQIGKSLDRQDTDLSQLLRFASDDVLPFVRLRKQTLDVTLGENLGRGWVDAAQVRDAMNHLLLNAIKFTRDGGVIGLSARRDETDPLSPTLLIEVRDNGLGIDAAKRNRLFEPFFTGFDVSRHSSGQYEFNRQGLGLGLSVVREFIQMHGGSINVQSEVGQGTTFHVRLPVGPNQHDLAATHGGTIAHGPIASN